MQITSLAEGASLEEWRARAEIGAVLLASACASASVTVLAVRAIFPGRNVIFARWGFSHVASVAALVLLALAAAGTAVSMAGVTEPPLLLELAITAAVGALACGAIAYFAWKLDPAGVRCLGLWKGRHARATFAGITAYAMSTPGLFGLLLVWPWFLTEVGIGFEQQEIAQRFQGLPRDQIWIAAVFGVAVLPLFEETVFRAFLQPLLVQNFSEKGGVVLTSIAFAAMHGTNAFLPIFGLSLVLGGVMLRTQRLSAVWAVHALHNGISTLALFAGRAHELPPPSGGSLLFSAWAWFA